MRRLACIFLLLLGVVGTGYGPRSVTSTGNIVKWNLPVSVHLECDLDVRGKDVTSLVEEGFSAWVDLTDSAVTITEDSLGSSVDADNVCCFVFDSSACPSGPANDGKNPIIIDDDGTVIAKFFGAANRYTTLGFAAIVNFNATSGEALKGEAVFNAACLEGVEMEGCVTAGLSFSDNDFASFIVHEMGHFLGLNHSQVNLDEASDSDTSNDDKITTMFPFFIQGNGANFKTPERDDQVGLAVFYPTGDFSGSNFSVAGTVHDSNGTTEFACANLVARNTRSSLARSDAVSYVSGQLCAGGNFDGSCDGDYRIEGLRPSETYALTAEPLDSDFRNSSGIPPCEGFGQQPTFTSQTTSATYNNTGGNATSGVDFTLAGASGNVNSLALDPLDFLPVTPSDGGDIEAAVLEIERQTSSENCPSATATCSSSSGDDASGSGGCSLIPLL